MIRWRTLALDLLCDMVGGILYAVGIYTFAKWQTSRREGFRAWRC